MEFRASMTALRTGRISGDAAYAVAGAVSVLDPDLARAVDRELGERLPELDGAGTRRWKDAVAAIASAATARTVNEMTRAATAPA